MESREELRRRGAEISNQLFGPRQDKAGQTIPNYDELQAELVYGGIWSRPGLAVPDRMICSLASLSVAQYHVSLRKHVRAAIRLGIEPLAIIEIFLQSGQYAGFETCEQSSEIASSVFIELGVQVSVEPPARETLAELMTNGQKLIEELHGTQAKTGYAAPNHRSTGEFYQFVVQHAYGNVWYRPGLTIRQRVLVSLASFTSLRVESQLRKFAKSALNVGLTQVEVWEAIIQTFPFTGLPAVLNALTVIANDGE